MLTRRQLSLYSERADLYRQVTTTDSSMLYELMFSNIPCQFVPTDNFDNLHGATRLKQNNIQTSDSIHFQSDQEIGEGWVIYVRPGSARVPGQWLVTLGAPEIHPRRAKYTRLYVNAQFELTEDMIQ